MDWSANNTGRLRAGDKSGIFRALNWVKTFTIALLMLLASSAVNVTAQDSPWSFIEHPQPTHSQLSEEDTMLIDQAYFEQPGIDILCEQVVKLEYEVYQKYYPDYIDGGDADAALLNWKVHAVTTEVGALDTCVYFQSVVAISPFLEAEFEPDLFYCGVYSRLPQTDNERRMIKLFDEYEMLVKAGDWLGASNILSLDNMENNVTLNNDVHYYFSLLLEPFLDADARVPELVNLSPDISDQRKAFVEQAAANLDLQSVLDTTGSCAPRN